MDNSVIKFANVTKSFRLLEERTFKEFLPSLFLGKTWVKKDLPIDDSNPLFVYDANKCVLCGRCVWECQKHREKALLGFAHRGFERRLTTFGDEPIGKDRCLDCSECVKVCPTGALALNKRK